MANGLKADSTGAFEPPDFIAFCLGFAAVATLLIVSGYTLDWLGFGYGMSDGSILARLHPSTYLISLTVLYLLARVGIRRLIAEHIRTNPGLIIYAIAVTAILVAALTKKLPVTSPIDTFLAPVLFFIFLIRLSSEQHQKLANFFHVFMFVNTVIGIGEYLAEFRLLEHFPTNFVTAEDLMDLRPYALLGHPLQNAFVLGAYLVCIGVGGQPRTEPLKASLFILHLLGLAVFGGRTSLVIALIIFMLLAARHFARLLLGTRFHILTVPAGITVITLFIGALVAAISSGMLERVADRFQNDEGSAGTRLSAFKLLERIDGMELLYGTDPDRAFLLQIAYTSHYGVEIAWLALIIQYGLILTLLLFLGLNAYLLETVRATARGAFWVLIYFHIVATSSLGISSKSTIISLITLTIFMTLRTFPATSAVSSSKTPADAPASRKPDAGRVKAPGATETPQVET